MVTPTAVASNATLRVALNRWSRAIGADAHSVSLAAQRRHPRRMTYSAVRFSRDARRAGTAIGAQHASTAKGRRARRLALSAFSKYAAAGRGWAASGRARLIGKRPAAARYARNAAVSAHAGSRLLVAAGKLLR